MLFSPSVKPPTPQGQANESPQHPVVPVAEESAPWRRDPGWGSGPPTVKNPTPPCGGTFFGAAFHALSAANEAATVRAIAGCFLSKYEALARISSSWRHRRLGGLPNV